MNGGNQQSKTLVITPEGIPVSFRWKELWRYRDLILMLAKKTFLVHYKQTVLGPLWALIRPLITALVLTVTFQGIIGIDTGEVPGVLFYLCGYSFWLLFSEIVSTNSKTFVDNAYLFGKVYFPRLAVPLAELLVSLLDFVIRMLLLVCMMLGFACAGKIRIDPSLWILLPLFALQASLLGLSSGVIVSSLTAKYRDLVMLVGFALQLWMYLTPVIYPVSQIGNPVLQKLLWLNPMTAPVELFRACFFGTGPFLIAAECYSLAVTAAAALIAFFLFAKIEQNFMDTV